MMKSGLVLVLLMGLAGCKVTLYSNVGEAEANQMLALLMLRKIPADKVAEKGGTVTLKVEKSEFINAVEVLRQNGYPQHKRLGMEDLFPSNQLVTSPAQERAKMMLLKEQQLESMLSAMDGVISAKVSIAQKMDENGKPTGVPSAAVFIKYSPQFNFGNYETQIRSLVSDGVPDIQTDEISVVMQAAEYRYQEAPEVAAVSPLRNWIAGHPGQAAAAVAVTVAALSAISMLGLALLRRRRKADA